MRRVPLPAFGGRREEQARLQLVVDIDSTIKEAFGKLKRAVAYGYTKVLGHHPILATRADTGEFLHVRMRKGSAHPQDSDSLLFSTSSGHAPISRYVTATKP
jgi:hypothetical protein